jgi:DnaJ-class molecular chaperone
MRAKPDYYEVLGVPRGADEKAIKTAYRRLARRYHPDMNPGDRQAEERFKEISEAFAVLSDPEKRARYDRGGHSAFGPDFDPFAGTGFSFRTTGLGGFPDLSELFEMLGLGGEARRGGHRGPRRGRDLELEVRIPFAEAIRGTTLRLTVPRRDAGGARVEERIQVRIPPGVEEGSRVRVPGKGDAGESGAQPGDAFLVLRVDRHPSLRREGRDLVCTVPVGVAEAVLGGTVSVPTLEGSATVSLPAGTPSGRRLRLRGRGVPGHNGQPAGDLLAIVEIHPPKKLDRRSRELMEEFARLNPGS